jgi:hypothetical protein
MGEQKRSDLHKHFAFRVVGTHGSDDALDPSAHETRC